jgi:hypothetical protein
LSFSWWNAEFWWRSPAIWIAASVILYVAGRIIAREIDRRAKEMPAAWSYLKEALTALYCVLPAFAAIPLAVLSPADLGVESYVWLPRLFEGLGMLAAFLAIFLSFVLVSRRKTKTDESEGYRWWNALRAGVYWQSHWALYRGAVAAAGIGLYAATWAGAAIALMEWGVVGLLVGFPKRGVSAAYLAVLIVTSALFLYSRNLWLCMSFNWLALWVTKGKWG